MWITVPWTEGAQKYIYRNWHEHTNIGDDDEKFLLQPRKALMHFIEEVVGSRVHEMWQNAIWNFHPGMQSYIENVILIIHLISNLIVSLSLFTPSPSHW